MRATTAPRTMRACATKTQVDPLAEGECLAHRPCKIEQTRSQVRTLPRQVALSSLGPLPQEPRLERKLIMDVVKIAAYNAQAWLADGLARHYANTNDLYDLLRSCAHLSGTLIYQADGGLRVCLQPPDLPLQRRALTGLCAELNLSRPVFPGTHVAMHYEVVLPQLPSGRCAADASLIV
jgi:hypothetical protein